MSVVRRTTPYRRRDDPCAGRHGRRTADARPAVASAATPHAQRAGPGRHRGLDHGQHRARDELLLRLRVPRSHCRHRLAADHHRRRRGDRLPGQHARPVLACTPVDRLVHHLHRQGLRTHERHRYGSHPHHRLRRRHHLRAGDVRRLHRHLPEPLPALDLDLDVALVHDRLRLPGRVPHGARHPYLDALGRHLLRLRDDRARRRQRQRPRPPRRASDAASLRPPLPLERLQGPRSGLSPRNLPVHRLGELGHARRGDREPATQRAPRPVCQRRADDGELRALRLRDGRGLRRERRRAQRLADPLHHGGRQLSSGCWPSLPTSPA